MSDVKQFNILSAKAFGDAFDSRAGKLQRYYLTLEGFDSSASVAWDKKADAGPPQSGPVWGYLTDETTKAGKAYKKFHKQSPPDGTPVQAAPQAAGQSVSVNVGQDTITWGQAVVAAAMAKGDKVDDVLAFANIYYNSKPTPPPVVPEEESWMKTGSEDVVLEDLPSKIDLSDIPFS